MSFSFFSSSFADAFNAAYMKARGTTQVYSWDTDFDSIEGITRLEPEELLNDNYFCRFTSDSSAPWGK